MITASKPDYAPADEALFEKFRALYEGKTVQLPVSGHAVVRKGQPVTLEVRCREVGARGEGAVVQQAMKQPLSEEKVRSQLTKTGGTTFAFAELTLDMEPDVFLPVQELNALRRTALEQLETKLLAGWRRVRPAGHMEAANRMAGVDRSSVCVKRSDKRQANETDGCWVPVLTASVETAAQLQAVLETPDIADVYLSSRLFFPTEAKRGQHPGKRSFPDVRRTGAPGRKTVLLHDAGDFPGGDGFPVRATDSYASGGRI